MATKFFTNEGNKTLLEKFKGIFEYNTDIERFDALVGYFRASGYFSVRPFLYNDMRICDFVMCDRVNERMSE
ncbi:MAG: hypothetical protein IPL08_14960 [Saprospiraceae bacterium]|nr:hypothetical protein [Saprospiraceae bacterium]